MDFFIQLMWMSKYWGLSAGKGTGSERESERKIPFKLYELPLRPSLASMGLLLP